MLCGVMCCDELMNFVALSNDVACCVHVVSICWRYMLSRFAVLSFVVMVVLCCPCWVVVCCLVMDRFDR